MVMRIFMKLAIILTTNNSETNWNALRLANFSISKGDEVVIFLSGAGVEYEFGDSEKFNIKEQTKMFLQSDRAHIMACGTCMKSRDQEGSSTCPINGLSDLYNLTLSSDKVISF